MADISNAHADFLDRIYVLDAELNVVSASGLTEWLVFMKDKAVLGTVQVGEVTVETVFLGMNIGSKPVKLFEIRLFRDDKMLPLSYRADTFDDAMVTHHQTVATVRKMQNAKVD